MLGLPLSIHNTSDPGYQVHMRRLSFRIFTSPYRMPRRRRSRNLYCFRLHNQRYRCQMPAGSHPHLGRSGKRWIILLWRQILWRARKNLSSEISFWMRAAKGRLWRGWRKVMSKPYFWNLQFFDWNRHRIYFRYLVQGKRLHSNRSQVVRNGHQ